MTYARKLADEDEDMNYNCLDGMRCPKCKSWEPFDITVVTTVRMYDYGSEDSDNGDQEWGDDSYCSCLECNFRGVVRDFQIEFQEKPKPKPRRKRGRKLGRA